MSVCLGLFDSGVGGLTVLRSILLRHGPFAHGLSR